MELWKQEVFEVLNQLDIRYLCQEDYDHIRSMRTPNWYTIISLFGSVENMKEEYLLWRNS